MAERAIALDRSCETPSTEIDPRKSASIRNPVDLLSHDVFLNKIVCHLYL